MCKTIHQKSSMSEYIGPDLLTACASANPFLALKNYCQDLLKTRSENLARKRRGNSYFCGWTYCWSFPFRCEIYGRRLFKWIMQSDLVRFALVNLLLYAALFTAKKKKQTITGRLCWSLWKWSGCGNVSIWKTVDLDDLLLPARLDGHFTIS